MLVLVAAVLAMTAALPAERASAAYRGVQLHSLWPESSPRDMYGELNLARHAGSNAVRVDLGWGNLQPDRRGVVSNSYLSKMDAFVYGANRRGMRVLVTLLGTPCWASSAPSSIRRGCRGAHWRRGVQDYPPIHSSDYASIARFITRRYGTRLAGIEVWNEPNNPHGRFWRSSNPAGAYARLLRAAYPAVKGANRSVPVLAASLSNSDRGFLRQLYAHGIKGHYDGLADHPYNDPTFSGLKALRLEQLAHGDLKPIWVTEFGWPTGNDPRWHVSEGEQAALITRSVAELRVLPWVAAAFVYNLRDKGWNRYDLEHNMGLLRRNFRPKPSYGALRQALR